MLKKVFLIAVLTCAFLNLAAVHGSTTELSHMAKSKSTIKVFIKDIVNESGQSQILPETFKKDLERAMLERRSTTFKILKNPESCDIQISAIIKSYRYMERGPFKPTPSIAGLLLDAAASATENYVDMDVEFTVTDTRAGNILKKDIVTAHIKEIMTPEHSISLIYDKITRTFLWKFFGKGR